MTKNLTLAFLANGRSVHTVRWVRYFADRGYDVHLITFTSKPIEGVKIHELRHFGKIAYPMRIWKIRRAVKKIDPDILHAHYISHYGVYAALIGFHPLILSAWGSDISVDPEKSRIGRLLVTFTLKRADLVSTGDYVGKQRLIELGCNADKIFMQPSGVDTSLFSPKARSLSLRKKLGIGRTYSVILARWWRKKYNVDVFIRAVPLILKEIPNVRFILLGGGPLESGLKELAKKLRVYESVLFIGKIPHELMPEYLASVDLYVDTFSDYRIKAVGTRLTGQGGGGMGATTREAMACGTPQILSDNINVRSGKWFQGLMYRQLSHENLAEKIVQLLSNEMLRKKIGEKSRKAALEICNLHKCMKKWEAIYQQLRISSRRT